MWYSCVISCELIVKNQVKRFGRDFNHDMRLMLTEVATSLPTMASIMMHLDAVCIGRMRVIFVGLGKPYAARAFIKRYPYGDHIYVDPSTTLYRRLGLQSKAKFYGCRQLCGQILRAIALCCCKCWCPCGTGIYIYARYHIICVLVITCMLVSYRWCHAEWWFTGGIINR